VKNLVQRKESGPVSLSAENFCEYFSGKVETLRASFPLDNCIPSEVALTDAKLSKFMTVNEDDVLKVIKRSSTKTCDLDPWPTWLLKEHIPSLLPIITRIINMSLTTSQVPAVMKQALVMPRLKKPSLDLETPSNYRPVSNLAFVSKVLERVVTHQLTDYFNKNSLHHPYQSAYRANHSVETALVRVHNDIMKALDQQLGVVLILLDLSAAFDTVDHSILLKRLECRLGLSGSALDWMISYLSERQQKVMLGATQAKPTVLNCGVPQGSVLGPVLFSAYVSPLGDIAKFSATSTHQYADDCQLYVTFKPKEQASVKLTRETIEGCVWNISRWMADNRLKQNDDKTELIVFMPPRIQNGISLTGIHVGDAVISQSPCVRNLGSIWDQCMNVREHVKYVCSSCYFHLHNISAIRDSLTRDATEKIVHAFVTSRLDFNNSLLYLLPKKYLARLQRIQNTAARIVVKAPKYSSISSILQALHWLPLQARIEYKISIMTWKALSNLAPCYIVELLLPYRANRSLRSNDSNLLVIPRTRTNFGERAFSIAAPKIWNSLPPNIRQLEQSFDSFKSSLKTHLFRKFYEL